MNTFYYTIQFIYHLCFLTCIIRLTFLYWTCILPITCIYWTCVLPITFNFWTCVLPITFIYWTCILPFTFIYYTHRSVSSTCIIIYNLFQYCLHTPYICRWYQTTSPTLHWALLYCVSIFSFYVANLHHQTKVKLKNNIISYIN